MVLDDLVAMSLFARVVELGSVEAAAREAGLRTADARARLEALEGHLGQRLFRKFRKSRARVVLSRDGVRHYARCSRVLCDAAELAAPRGVARGVLRVSAPPAFASRHLTAPIATLLARHPEVRVALHLDARAGHPLEDGVDLALVLRASRPDAETSGHVLASDRLVLCASPSYLRVRGVPWTPEDLVRHHVVAGRTATALRFRPRAETEGSTALAPLFFGGNAHLSADEDAFLREAAIAGLGIAAVPVSLVAEALDDGSLVEVLERDVEGELALVALTPPHPVEPAKVRAFLDILRAEWACPPWAPLLLRGGDPGELDAAERAAGPEAPRRPKARRRTKAAPDVVVTTAEVRRLGKVLELFDAVDPEAVATLRASLATSRPPHHETERARVVPVHANVTLREGDGQTREVVLVYPWEAASERGLVSVLAPLGAAILGLPVGAAVSVPSGHGRPRTFTVVAVAP